MYSCLQAVQFFTFFFLGWHTPPSPHLHTSKVKYYVIYGIVYATQSN